MNIYELLLARPEFALLAVLLAVMTILAAAGVMLWAEEKFEEVDDDEFDC